MESILLKMMLARCRHSSSEMMINFEGKLIEGQGGRKLYEEIL